MFFYNLLCNRETNAGAFIGVFPMKLLEQIENALCIFLLEANAVVLHAYVTVLSKVLFSSREIIYTLHRADVNHCRLAFPGKLNGVAEKILKALTHLARVDFQPWQMVDNNAGTFFGDGELHIIQ